MTKTVDNHHNGLGALSTATRINDSGAAMEVADMFQLPRFAFNRAKKCPITGRYRVLQGL
jgi:hypothetical protein